MAANIFIGCGGSGIQTLAQLNGLLAEDPYWRPRLARDVYYVVVDTRTKEIEAFLEALHRQVGDAIAPHVTSIRLAQNRTFLQPLVNEHFVAPFANAGAGAVEASARLQSHWWSTRDGKPFMAPRVRPLSDGAGQCPPVSYFLTWYDLPRIEAELAELFEHVIPARRGGDGTAPLDGMSVGLVAGLAGGTGRGTWELLAFKLREMLLAKHGVTARPVAYLYDASVFHRLAKDRPETEVPMKVNGLTGLSQLSCWVSPSDAQYQYDLPRMQTPGDPATDILKVHLGFDLAAGSPVDNACIITGTNGFTTLASHEDYFAMVARGLYATLARSAINGVRINTNYTYLSLGAATFEVSAVSLRRYFEGMYRVKVLESLRAASDLAANRAADAFLEENGLRIGVTADRRGDYAPKADGTLLQRMLHQLNQSSDIRAGFAALGAAFEEDDPESVQQAVEALLDPRPAAVRAAFAAAAKSFSAVPEAALREAVQRLLQRSGSVHVVQRFLEAITAALDTDVEALPDETVMTVIGDEDPVEYARQAASRPFLGLSGLVGVERFSSAEEEGLRSRVEAAVSLRNYAVVRKAFEERYAAISGVAATLLGNAGSVLRRADGLRERLRDEVRAEMGGQSLDLSDVHVRLFGEPSSPEDAVPDEFSQDRFFRRTVKPFLRSSDVSSTLPAVEGLGERLLDVVTEGVLSLTSGDGAASTSALQALSRRMEDAVRAEAQLPPRFVDDRFSLAKVLVGHRDAWIARLNAVHGNQDLVGRLARRYEAFYGVAPISVGGEWTLPSEREQLWAMGRSLAAVCRPYWTLRGAGGAASVATPYMVTLFYPLDDAQLGRAAAEGWIRKELAASHTRVEVQTADQLDGGGGNPFVLAAYSTAGTPSLSDVASLDYSTSALGLYDLLNQCEDPSGSSIFDHPKGLGYTSPIYVREPRLLRLRWRPWLRPAADKAQAEAAKVHDALLYALATLPEPLAASLAQVGFTLPLVKDAGRQKFVFARRALRLSRGNYVEDTKCPWARAEQPIAQSLCNVASVLGGVSSLRGAQNPDAVLWLARITEESALFWGDAARRFGFGPGTDLRRTLVGHLDAHFGRLAQGADAEDRPVWTAIVDRVRKLEEV